MAGSASPFEITLPREEKRREDMESRGVCLATVLAVVVTVLAVMAPEAAAQASTPACAAKLLDCQEFISTTTTPSTTCCNTIKDLVQNELACLCALLTNKDLLKNFNIDVTQAMGVPRRCGITGGTNLCTSPAKGPSAPPATPGAPTGAAVGVRTGASTLVVLVAFWWSLFA